MTKTARTVAADPRYCILPNGAWEHAITAKAAGYIVFDEDRQAQIRAIAEEKVTDKYDTPAARAAARADLDRLDREDYAHAIRSLPEARSRRAAAGRVIACHTARSMPPAAAAMFLRNLPVEDASAPVPTSEPRHVEPPEVPLKRKVDLALATATTRAAGGDHLARRRVEAIGGALRLHHERGVDLQRALDLHLVHL